MLAPPGTTAAVTNGEPLVRALRACVFPPLAERVLQNLVENVFFVFF